MKRLMVMLAACASMLTVGGGIASAGVSPSPAQSLTQGLQQALINQSSALLIQATNSVNAGGNVCFAGCPSVAIGTNLVNATQLNIAVSTQALTQVALEFNNIGSPTINIIGIQLVGG